MENEGLLQFAYLGKKDYNVRKRVRCENLKMKYGVSHPSEPSAKKLKQMIASEIETGTLEIGENIVGREYQKRIYDKKTGQIVTKTFTVFGRKQKLRNIRIKCYEKSMEFMRLNSDEYFETISYDEVVRRLSSINELDQNDTFDAMKNKLKRFERTRHLQVWHDGSAIKNHGHIVFCVNVLYDPAVFYTS